MRYIYTKDKLYANKEELACFQNIPVKTSRDTLKIFYGIQNHIIDLNFRNFLKFLALSYQNLIRIYIFSFLA